MYREHLPSGSLHPYVDRLWTRSPGATPPDEAGRLVLPDGCIDVLVHLGEVPSVVVVGAMTAPFDVPPGPETPIAAVRFRPGGAVPFLRHPASDFTDLHVPIADVGSRLSDLSVRFEGIRDPDQALSILAAELSAHLARAVRPHRVVAEATRRLWTDEAPTIDQLSSELGCTRQHLSRLFREHVGVGPKELARVARFQRALAHLSATPRPSLSAIAADLGYFDQAHMNRDFRDLARSTPAQALRTGSIFPIRPVL